MTDRRETGINPASGGRRRETPRGGAGESAGACESGASLCRHPPVPPFGLPVGRLSRSARFMWLKNLFHDRKTRYRGLAKNTAQLEILFALANLFLARNSLQPA